MEKQENNIFSLLEKVSSETDKLSSKQRREFLSMLLGKYGFKLQTYQPVVIERKPKQPGKGKTPPKRENRNPEVKKLRTAIDDINRRISLKSKEIGKPLSEGDSLIEERSELFRDLKEVKEKALYKED